MMDLLPWLYFMCWFNLVINGIILMVVLYPYLNNDKSERV